MDNDRFISKEGKSINSVQSTKDNIMLVTKDVAEVLVLLEIANRNGEVMTKQKLSNKTRLYVGTDELTDTINSLLNLGLIKSRSGRGVGRHNDYLICFPVFRRTVKYMQANPDADPKKVMRRYKNKFVKRNTRNSENNLDRR